MLDHDLDPALMFEECSDTFRLVGQPQLSLRSSARRQSSAEERRCSCWLVS
jgi:hypothetical protein